jgi:2-oxoglutarate dehydrogenase E2 component (dihydrolipoamide succinyltransferase)
MPKMGESITEGTVIAWHKQVGDAIEVDETLLEIGTDKVDTDVPSPSAGTLSSILVAEGETVEVGTAIAVIETSVGATVAASSPTDSIPGQKLDAEPKAVPADLPAAETNASRPVTSAATPPANRPAAPAVSSPAPQPASGPAIDVVMPKMGESIMEGTVTKWHKAIGDTIEVDETLLEIATDKVDSDVPSPAAGTLQEILAQEGDTVDVGTVIARIGSGVQAVATPQSAAPLPPVTATAAAAPSTMPPKSATAPTPVPAGGDGAVSRIAADGRFMSPLVRSIAEKEGLSARELESISGSGHEGRITKNDVLAYMETRATTPAPAATPAAATPAAATQTAETQTAAIPAAAPAAPRPTAKSAPVETTDGDSRLEVIEMDRMRQIIAQHMIQSKQTSAHVTSFAEADLTNLVKLRESEKDAFFKREGVKLTYTPFFVHAAVDALREHPIMNSSVDGTKILVKKDYHIGIAVAIGKSGLVVPVIRSAGRRNIAGLAHEAADLADRARNRQLQPDDLQGGTFTVTNIGSLGSIMGTPIIAQPQVAILATGAIKKRAVVMEDDELGDIIAIRNMMYVSLSYDHRIIDGAMASSFLHHFVTNLEAFRPGIEL